MLGKSALVWVIMAFLMIANGALRELLVAPRAGAYAGHVISVFAGAMVIMGVTYMFVRKYGSGLSRRAAWRIGGLWLALTVAFEFGFFRFVEKVPWSTLLADYNILRGRLWLVILITVLLAPVLWLRRLQSRSGGRPSAAG
jgi:hypothetical protein